jgi:thiol:disulfide interchange protein DsbD
MRRTYSLTAFVVLVLGLLVAQAGTGRAQENHELPLKTDWELFRYQAGDNTQRLLAVLAITPDEGWHVYSHEPGDIGRPTDLQAFLSGNDEPLPVIYPPGEPKMESGVETAIYQGPTPLVVPLPEDASPPFSLQATLSVLLCTAKRCLPAEEDLLFMGAGFNIPALPAAEEQDWWPLAAPSLVDEAQASGPAEPEPQADDDGFAPEYLHPSLEVGGLAAAVLFGLLAGLILNVMPCVLPVVTLKLNSLLSGGAETSAASRRRVFREHNVFFALGVLVYFLALSALLGLTGMNWGAVFQEPAVVMVLTAVVFGLSLSLLGVYNLPVIDLKFSRAAGASPKVQALFAGLLATILATPCSGPFLGGVLGWALIQPPLIIAAVFAAIGLGMASPYLLMSLFPGLVRFAPKPGPWTGYLEKAVGFFLLGTCIYLLSILPERRLIVSMGLLWATGLGAWLWGLAGPGASRPRRAGLRLGAVLAVGAGLVFALAPVQERSVWQAFDQESFQRNLGYSPMLVEFTADWCPTCKVLEKTVLTDSRMQRLKNRYGLVLLKADLTEPHPEAERLLDRLGAQSIPAAAIFPPGGAASRPLVLRDLFSASQLEQALERTLDAEAGDGRIAGNASSRELLE